jgi:hypothetical protein
LPFAAVPPSHGGLQRRQRSDSAGLAVLLDWLALAKRQGRAVRFMNLPAPIRAVAHISEVESLLSQGVTVNQLICRIPPTKRKAINLAQSCAVAD